MLCSFSDFLIEFVAAVSPRSLHGLAGKVSNLLEISSQFSDLERVIKRLVFLGIHRAFEKEGWKRIGGVDRFFFYFGLDGSFRDAFELSYLQVGHPNSATNAQFYLTAQ